MRAAIILLALASCAAPGEWLTRGDRAPIIGTKFVVPAYETVGHYEEIGGVWQRPHHKYDERYFIVADGIVIEVSQRGYKLLEVGDRFSGGIK